MYSKKREVARGSTRGLRNITRPAMEGQGHKFLAEDGNKKKMDTNSPKGRERLETAIRKKLKKSLIHLNKYAPRRKYQKGGYLRKEIGRGGSNERTLKFVI